MVPGGAGPVALEKCIERVETLLTLRARYLERVVEVASYRPHGPEHHNNGGDPDQNHAPRVEKAPTTKTSEHLILDPPFVDWWTLFGFNTGGGPCRAWCVGAGACRGSGWWVVGGLSTAGLSGGASGPGVRCQPEGPGSARRALSVWWNWWAQGQRAGNRRVGCPLRLNGDSGEGGELGASGPVCDWWLIGEVGGPGAEVVGEHGTRESGTVRCVVS